MAERSKFPVEKNRIGVIFGGKSGEHEVSLMSAKAVIKAINNEKHDVVMIGIDRDGRWLLYKGDVDGIVTDLWEENSEPIDIGKIKELIDFALPIVHGTYGEDGTIQGLFEMLDVPYAGCGVLSSSMCMDKVVAKDLFVKYGIPTCDYMMVTREELDSDMDAAVDRIWEYFDGHVFVKPSNMGSSVGISKASDRESLRKALAEAAKFDRRIIVEEAVDAREVETAVIGNNVPQIGSVGEIIAGSDFYDYHAKYTDDSGSRLVIPAPISPEAEKKIRELAVRAYKAMDCTGFARVDFFVDRETEDVLINEINTIPGFTKYSMFPLLWKDAGIEFSDLIEKIVEFGYERYNDKNNRQTVYR